MRYRDYVIKMLHSLLGLALFLFLCEHLWTNSLAGLTKKGEGFVEQVNFLHSLPFLVLIEILFLGVPFALHAIWGILLIRKSKLNVSSRGEKPSLPYVRNRAFSWQRISAIFLLFAIAFHVVQMRFVEYPKENKGRYEVLVSHKESAQNLARELGDVHLIDLGQEEELRVAAPNFGTAVLFTVRSTFTGIGMSLFYSLFVFLTAYHTANGLWTLGNTLGFLTSKRRRCMLGTVAFIFFFAFVLLGFSAIWGSYFINFS